MIWSLVVVVTPVAATLAPAAARRTPVVSPTSSSGGVPCDAMRIDCDEAQQQIANDLRNYEPDHERRDVVPCRARHVEPAVHRALVTMIVAEEVEYVRTRHVDRRVWYRATDGALLDVDKWDARCGQLVDKHHLDEAEHEGGARQRADRVSKKLAVLARDVRTHLLKRRLVDEQAAEEEGVEREPGTDLQAEGWRAAGDADG
eukprot:scaffold11428_cov105-Isochrysis_galbana.AAC.1